MASTKVATIGGTFLRPGVSKNKRLYTTENIGRAVKRMQTALESGTIISMATSHADAAADSALSRVGRVVAVEQADDGSARWVGEVANTSIGRDIATLGQGKFIGPVSIRGSWAAEPYTVEHDGESVDTADDLSIVGIDFTNKPGVEGAGLDFVQLAESYTGSDRTKIFESEDAVVLEVFAEETPDDTQAEFLVALQAVAEDFLEANKTPYGNVPYADPGYQSDGKKRYPVDTAKHVRAAWSYINQSDNQKVYSPAQVARIKSRIKSAAKKFGINVKEEFELFKTDIKEALEAYVSQIDENADTDKIAKMVDDFALSAFSNLFDADEESAILPEDSEAAGDGNTNGDPENQNDVLACTFCGNAPPENAMFCPNCGTPINQAESTGEAPTTKENAVAEEIATATSTEETGTTEPVVAPSLNTADISAIADALAARFTPPVAVETAPVIQAAPVAPVVAPVAAAPAPVAPVETAPTPEATVAETETVTITKADLDAAVAAAVEAKVAEATEDYRKNGGPRKGLTEDAGPTTEGGFSESDFTVESLSEMNTNKFREAELAAWKMHPGMAPILAEADRVYASRSF